MNRLLILLCLLLLMILMTVNPCCAETEARYSAITNTAFHLRAEPDGRRLAEVPKGSRITISEWGEDWCLATYRGTTGYCKTDWTYSLCSLDPFLYPLPGSPCPAQGYVTLLHATTVKAGDYDGTLLPAGTTLCAKLTGDGDVELHVWRDVQRLSDDDAVYQPFIAWDKASPGDVIGGFTTYFCDRQGKTHPKERANNIRIGCTRINGLILASGERFSFNAVCGPYRKSNGYYLAPNISRAGEGYGGGVCQVSTTLYNALLTAPLQVEEWSIHRYKGVDYVPQFFDAAVGTHANLIFSNPLPYPIQLRAHVEAGAITILILRAE